MTNAAAGLLAVFVAVAAVALSMPAAAVVLLLARRWGQAGAAVRVCLVVVALVVAVAIVVGTVAGPTAAATLAGAGFAGLGLLWVLPVLVGRYLVRRLAAIPPDAALGYAVAGLPAAMLVGAVVFVAPGGPTSYNLTFLTGPLAWAAWTLLGAVVLFGPGLAGVGLYRLAHRR